MPEKEIRLIGLFLLLLWVCGCVSDWQRHNNKEYGFSILLPRSWIMAKDSYPAALSVKSGVENKNDAFQENINVMVTDFSAAMELSTFFELNKDELMYRLKGIANIQQGDIYAGLLPGKWLSFEGRMKDMNLKIMVAIWKKDKRIYTITCTAETKKFPAYAPIFTKIMKSLRIK